MSTLPQNPTKHPFSLITVLCALLILVIGLVIPSQSCLPSNTRCLLFVPYALCLLWTILYTTTGNPQGDMGAGGALGTLLLVGVDFLILTDAQKALYPVDDAGNRIGIPTWEASLSTRIKWALQLIGNPRGIGWNFEPTFILKERARMKGRKMTRVQFVLRQLMRLVSFVVLDQLGTRLCYINPVFTSKYPSTSNATDSITIRTSWRVLGLAAFAVTSYARIEVLHCAVSMVAVGTFNSKFQNWPPMFGSIKDARTIQFFWGRIWHQSIRRSLTSCTDSVASSYPREPLASFLRLGTAFTITGVVHGAGEYMMVTSLPMNTLKSDTRGDAGQGACTFFILQACAIVAEKITARSSWPRIDQKLVGHGEGPENARSASSVHQCARREPTIVTRTLGYLWVMAWLLWSVQYFVDPMIVTGVFDSP